LLTVTTSTTAATCGNNGSATGTAHGGTSPYNYSWASFGAGVTISAIGPGLYTVIATDSNGCIATDTARVVHSGQTAGISASHNVSCFGGNNGSATVSVIGGDTLLYGYQWTGGQTNATATNLSAGVDTVFVTYIANGCTDTVYDTITQPSKLHVTYNDTTKCNSVRANVQVFASGGVPSYAYSWNSGKTTASADTSLPGGSYTLVVTDKNGCTDSVKANIPAQALNANFKPKPDTILGGEFVYFQNLSSGENTWWWSFGNGNYSDSLDPYEQYGAAGIYDVYLHITNAEGCRDSIEEKVYVIENLYVPNVFTPNGDGINDAFHVSAGNMKEYALYIYNRWGEKVFESYNPNIDWTGTSDAGVPYSAGTYYYILKATDYEGKLYNLHGYLELIR
jgi:gliding motility-associated-like protein